MAWTNEEIETVYEKARIKAATDPKFRRDLLTEPNKTISVFAGKEIPAGFKIKVIEADPAYQATFVIPDLVKADLSDEELEKIAGGLCGVYGCKNHVEMPGYCNNEMSF